MRNTAKLIGILAITVLVGLGFVGCGGGDDTPPELALPLEMVEISGGTFKMGSPTSEVGRDENEDYRTAYNGIVTLSGFYMGKYPVTQSQYSEVIGTNPSYFSGNNLPVELVSWYDAIVFCNKLSTKEGLSPAYKINGKTDPSEWGNVPTTATGLINKATWDAVEIVTGSDGYRLPTEAQWEYACRAGTTTPFNTGNNITTSQANYDGNFPYNGNPKGTYRRTTTAVNIFAPNKWGLYDMHGNVIEWCWDWCNGSYNDAGGSTDPTGNVVGTLRVLRGGSWGDDGWWLRSAMRVGGDPYGKHNGLGFRVARP